MLILGIETSCDETAAAVLRGTGKNRVGILSSVISSQIKTHAKTGGVVPEVAARMHVEKIIFVIKQALKDAKIKLADINAVAVTAGPGLVTSLMVGIDTAKALSLALNIPVIPINHMEAHVFSSFITYPSSEAPAKSRKKSNIKFSTGSNNNIFPALSLVVSGGHTELVLINDWLDYKKIGATVDDAAGEAFDKIAKLLGLPYPGGPALSLLAKKGKPVIDFPRPMINSKNFNFSFSGLKTAVLYYLRDHQTKKSDVAASAQQSIIDVLISKTIRAAKKYKVKTISLGGGVAANKKLRAEMKRAIKTNSLDSKFLIPDFTLCTDNAVMIAFVGYLRAIKKARPRKKTRTQILADANWEL